MSQTPSIGRPNLRRSPVEAPPAPEPEIDYPTSDGEPMAETDKHRRVMMRTIDALELFFADRADDIYVSGNNFVYYERGNPNARVSPDVYVVEGAAQRLRDSYKSWEEGGRLPVFVLEVTSRKTHREDQQTKLPLYERLHVGEYFQFDPTGDYLSPRLQGFYLSAGTYQPIPQEPDSEEDAERLFSSQLRLILAVEGEMLRLIDPRTGRTLPTLQEAEQEAVDQAEARYEAEERASSAEERARAAEEENARLRAELERLRSGSGNAED